MGVGERGGDELEFRETSLFSHSQTYIKDKEIICGFSLIYE